ncbi:MAG: PD40 domain-containing protein [Bryobacterales bacterium]|nr:PD40 domain-containing protein [Bryobacterales bacterium]
MTVPLPPLPPHIERHLDQVVGSSVFAPSPRLCRFLRFIVERSAAGRRDELKESLIGVQVFDRTPGYDTKSDAIVRVEARRLRAKLDEYYEGPGQADTVRFSMPKGGYVAEITEAAPPPPVPTASPNPAPPRFALVASVIVIVALLTGFVAARRYAPPRHASEPRPLTTMPGGESMPAFSPDGRTLAFLAEDTPDGTTDIFLQPLDADQATPVTRTPQAEAGLAWSPDGKSLAFFRHRGDGRMTLLTRTLDGGAERSWGDVEEASSSLAQLAWSPDSRSLIAADREAPGQPLRLVRFWLAANRREWLTSPPVGYAGDSCPALSPDGRTLAFRRSRTEQIEDIYLLALADDPSRLPDPRRLTTESTGMRGLAWLPDGTALIASLQRGSTSRLLWRVPVNGAAPTRIPGFGLSAVQPAVSPNGVRLVWSTPDDDMNIWAIPTDASRPPETRIASTYFDMAPQYSPDGSRLVFRSTRTGVSALWTCDRYGRQLRKLIDFGGAQVSAPRWSPDGLRIVFETRAQGSSDLYIIPSLGGAPKPFVTGPSQEVLPWWSGDGRSIYYASDEAAGFQIWKRPVDGGPAQRLTTNGGFAPMESPDGRHVYYSKGASGTGLYRMPAEGGPEQTVLASLQGPLWGNWTLSRTTLFYLELLPAGADARAVIHARSLDGNATREVLRMRRLPARWDTGLAVSPDGRELLYAQLDRFGADLFLLEHWQ